MDNSTILLSLETQRDECYQVLISSTISERYQEMYDNVRLGRPLPLRPGHDSELLQIYDKLKEDKSNDQLFIDKVNSYKELNDTKLIDYFMSEFDRLFNLVLQSGKASEIQATFIEYNYY